MLRQYFMHIGGTDAHHVAFLHILESSRHVGDSPRPTGRIFYKQRLVTRIIVVGLNAVNQTQQVQILGAWSYFVKAGVPLGNDLTHLAQEVLCPNSELL